MDNKIITPGIHQPVDRVASGQLPSALAELSEAALAGAAVVMPLGTEGHCYVCMCSFDGDE